MNSLRSLKFEIKAPIPSRRNPEGNMLRCAAAALSFLSTSEQEAKLFPVPVFRRKSVSSIMFLLVATT